MQASGFPDSILLCVCVRGLIMNEDRSEALLPVQEARYQCLRLCVILLRVNRPGRYSSMSDWPITDCLRDNAHKQYIRRTDSRYELWHQMPDRSAWPHKCTIYIQKVIPSNFIPNFSGDLIIGQDITVAPSPGKRTYRMTAFINRSHSLPVNCHRFRMELHGCWSTVVSGCSTTHRPAVVGCVYTPSTQCSYGFHFVIFRCSVSPFILISYFISAPPPRLPVRVYEPAYVSESSNPDMAN